MNFRFKRKRLFLITAFVLVNVVLVLGFTVRNWFSPAPAAAELMSGSILVSTACVGEETPISLKLNMDPPSGFKVRWDFGDGAVGFAKSLDTVHTYIGTGTFQVSATIYDGGDIILTRVYQQVNVEYCELDVSENCCDGSFAPIPGKKYVVSAWVKEASKNVKIFENAYITLGFGYINPEQHAPPTRMVLGPFYAKGNIIDGWQRIEESFVVPPGVETMSVRMNNKGNNDSVYFDDIRIYPFDGNMKSYVYDPDTKRLVAEMDQNNYATLYEYDEEGQMVRVKKETERGVMTISESRSAQTKYKTVE
jgi:hypothetical protein